MSPIEILNNFWKSLPIRDKPYKDIIEVIHTKKQLNQEITEKKYLLLIDSLMKTQASSYELTIALFNKGLDEARKLQNEGLLFLSLFILGKGEKAEFISSFIGLAMTMGGLKNSIIIEGKDKIKHIRRAILKDFLEFYVKLITIMGIRILSSLTENKEIFEQYWNERVTDMEINTYVEDVLLAAYDLEKTEWIDIESFLDINYLALTDDKLIRNNFIVKPINK